MDELEVVGPSTEPGKYKCEDCGWLGFDREMLTAPNPFDPDDIVFGCPRCRSIDNFVGLCDEPGCNERGGMGTPTPNGYRWTCYAHHPNK